MDLSDLERDGDTSLTQQLVDRFVHGDRVGRAASGREAAPHARLAEEVGVNHLTAARVYRKLAELGYVTASVGRGTFVRSLAPAGQHRAGRRLAGLRAARAARSPTRSRCWPTPSRWHEPGMLSLATGWPAPSTYPVEELGADRGRRVRGGGRRGARPTCPPRASTRCASRSPSAGARFGLRHRRRTRSWSPRAPSRGCAWPREATLEPGDVAVVESPDASSGCSASLRATGARVIGVPVDEHGLDMDALERLLARHEVKLVALQTACQNPTGCDLVARAGAPPRRAGDGAQLLRARGPGVRRHALRGRAPALDPRAGARARDPRQLAVEGRRRPACASAGSPPAARSASASRWRSC